ncbi:MAG: amino acid permease [Balneolaceae bacterium]
MNNIFIRISKDPKTEGRPLPIFNNLSAIAVVVGIVIGIGIFRLPQMVAQNSSTPLQYISFWIAGGVISIIGALCYAELASKKPDAGGEYFFLREAFGPSAGFLFSWGRMTVIQTGSIALASFILGDYASVLYRLGPYSSSIYASLTVIGLTGLNIWGTSPSKNVQNFVTTIIAIVLITAGIYGLLIAAEFPAGSFSDVLPNSSAGSAMIFVLLTYGGWNEGVYLSAEIRDVRKNISRILLIGLGTITFIYVLINAAYLHVLGLETLRNSDTIGVALSNKLIGSRGAVVMAVVVIISALSTANATIITGARTNYALGRDFSMLNYIGQWNSSFNSPTNALLVQGAVSLGLVLMGSLTPEAVSTMVDYTAPVFWFFILLTTASLFVFRKYSDQDEDSFRVPLYPLTPLLFIMVCLYLLYSSIVFTGWGSLVGIGILLLGVPVYFAAKKKTKPNF